MSMLSEITSPSPVPGEAIEPETVQEGPTFPIYIPAPETEEPAEEAPEITEVPETQVPESPAPVEEGGESPSPEESPLPEAVESPVPTEETQELVAVETEEEVPAEPSPLGLIAGIAGGFVLGALVAAVIAKARAKGKKHKSLPILPSKIQGLAVQGQGSRDDQQDALFLSSTSEYTQQGILMCVADGMGGLSNGSMCSSTAASAAANKFANSDKSDPRRLMASLVQCSAASVNRLLSPNLGSGGSTLLLGYIRDSRFYYASVGDSRISLYREGRLIPLNRQHCFEDELMLHHVNGELNYEAATGHNKGAALTSYLGMGALKHLDMPAAPVPLRRGDRIILMSDGVFNALSDAEIAGILSLKPTQIHDSLIQAVEGKKLRYQDNYSAVIVVMD